MSKQQDRTGTWTGYFFPQIFFQMRDIVQFCYKINVIKTISNCDNSDLKIYVWNSLKVISENSKHIITLPNSKNFKFLE